MQKKSSDEQELFMRINNPALIRKNILESSKLVLTILKQAYNIKQIRELKQEKINRLSQEIKELRILVEKIEELMPQYTKADLKKLLPEINLTKKSTSDSSKSGKSEAKQQERQESIAAAPVSDMDRITKALDEVQKKLQTL